MSELTPRSELRPRNELRTRNGVPKVPGIARHGRLRRNSPLPSVFGFIAAALAVILVSGGSVAAIAFNSLYSKIDTVELIPPTDGPLPEIGAIEGGFNILIVGSDRCETAPEDCGERGSANLNDVNMLLHVSEDQSNAVAISFPRDMVVTIPECKWEDPDRGTKVRSTEPINVSLYYGGLPCVAQTVEELTGLPVQFAGLITFNGVIAMTDAIGGVPVCTTGPMIDTDSGINITEGGTHVLQGQQALAFLRTRGAVGDGSDLTRISSQQVYLSSLVRTLKSSATLSDPKKVYNLANAALSNMKLSSSLASINTMVSIGLALKNIPLERVTFVQYPGNTGADGVYLGKVKPNRVLGDAMMALVAADQPFVLDEAGDGRGSEADPNAPVEVPDPEATSTAPPVDNTGLPTVSNVRGQTAADYTCSITR